MNIQPNLRMGKSEFLAWVQAQQGRFELIERRVVMMTGGSRGHGIIVRRLAKALEKHLDSNRWAVWTSDFGVDVGPNFVRYPDVVVDVVGGRFQDLDRNSPLAGRGSPLPDIGHVRPPRKGRRISSIAVAVGLSRAGAG